MSLRIEGKIIHRTKDYDEDIIVADYNGKRTLYFGEGTVQSSMFLERPVDLVMDYSHAMMCALLFNRQPKKILLYGLGGGSLVKFLLSQVPDCFIEVVEISKKVVGISYGYFQVPRNHPQLIIKQEEGCQYTKSIVGLQKKYDLVLVDAFDDNGPASFFLQDDFLAMSRRLLSSEGIIAYNLWNRPKDNFNSNYKKIEKHFPAKVLKVALAESYRNAIVFGFAGKHMKKSTKQLRNNAKKMRQESDINFSKYARFINWQN